MYYVRTRVFNSGKVLTKYYAETKPGPQPNDKKYDEYIDEFATEQEAKDFIAESKTA